ncbi:hypothetical protein [Magnetovibrio sp.]|uniref:hypothetical protein n=1 Tax=Magnetovibrio sp. TaxID=2024836 RepID=UPI002F948754
MPQESFSFANKINRVFIMRAIAAQARKSFPKRGLPTCTHHDAFAISARAEGAQKTQTKPQVDIHPRIKHPFGSITEFNFRPPTEGPEI